MAPLSLGRHFTLVPSRRSHASQTYGQRNHLTAVPARLGFPVTSLTMPVSQNRRLRVLLRDDGCCRFLYNDGAFCASTERLTLHHVQPQRRGGGGEMENLVTVCRLHHDVIEGCVDVRLRQHEGWTVEGRIGKTPLNRKLGRRDMPTPKAAIKRAASTSPRFAGAALNKW